MTPIVRSYALHAPHNQVVTLIPGRDAWTGARMFRDLNAPRAASGVPGLAGRFTIDLWRGRYADTAKALNRAFRYGLTDSVVICQGKVEMSPSLQSRNVPFLPGGSEECMLICACR